MQTYLRSFSRKAFQHFFQLITRIGLCIACTLSSLCFADYKKLIDEDFWTKVYPIGGKTFYCESTFEKRSPILTVSHIYPTALIMKELSCRSERSCLRSSTRYNEIMSDLHNMVPVNSFYYFKLKGSIFGELDNGVEENECGIRKRLNIIEPRDNVKGDIARIHFYMHSKYGLPLNTSFLFLKTWDKIDPPSQEEIEKNQRIKTIQGNENPFISNPSLADELVF